ncbi:MAG: class I SAM-dependent DNA methyltransferase [Lachnospiraceae bacterium]
MQAYTSFAQCYDMFMDNVPYEEWSRYLIGLLQEYGIKEGKIAELGCGTGKMTRLLAAAGYQMTGIDLSQEMLEIACSQDNPNSILYLQQDMCELELCEEMDACVSICDCLNYILDEQDLVSVFSHVKETLRLGGVFIFDLNTIHKYRDLIGETTISEVRDTASFIWENYYDEEEQINEYDLTFFMQEDGDLFRRFAEVHYQRGYELETVKACLKEGGLQFVTAYNVTTHDPVTDACERMYIIAKKR